MIIAMLLHFDLSLFHQHVTLLKSLFAHLLLLLHYSNLTGMNSLLQTSQTDCCQHCWHWSWSWSLWMHWGSIDWFAQLTEVGANLNLMMLFEESCSLLAMKRTAECNKQQVDLLKSGYLYCYCWQYWCSHCLCCCFESIVCLNFDL